MLLLVACVAGVTHAPAGEWQGFPRARRAEFMRDFWGRRPLLIRGMLEPSEADILTPDELAGIACEEGVEARIICERGIGDTPWALLHGPFDDKDFAMLPEERWTLLVNEVNIVHPQVAALLQRRFALVPDWRTDDVMVSYAAPDGGIGAHTDNYDVFLLQGSGRRRWCIEERLRPADAEELVDGLAVRVLREFAPDRSWVLEAGDCLYLPPRIPHRGVSLDDQCMTYSIGYRAPKRANLLRALGELAGARCAEDDFFSEALLPGGAASEEGGEISAEAFEALTEMMRAKLSTVLDDPRLVRAWLGEQLTERWRLPLEFEGDHEGVDSPALLADAARRADADGAREASRGLALWRAEGVTFAFARGSALDAAPAGAQPAGGGAMLFVDGHAHDLSGDAGEAVVRAASLICRENPVMPADLMLNECPALAAALAHLAQQGKVFLAPPAGD